MTDPYDYSNTIATAASRARGDRLSVFYKVCESQKSISTRKLAQMLDYLAEGEKLDALHFRALADRIRKLEATIKEAN